MPESPLVVRRVDFADPHDTRDYLHLLDAYARDPMGGGAALSDTVLERLPRDLRRHPGAYCLMAEQDGEAVGFATCFLGYSTFLARPLLNIHDIAVLPEWRRLGAARHLIAGIETLARELDCCRITLEVREDNAAARRLYQATGFEPAEGNQFMQKPL